MSRGLNVRLNDLIPGYQWITQVGIGSITVDHFTKKFSNLLKYPQALSELIIFGYISLENLQFFMDNCPNLTRVGFELTSLNLMSLYEIANSSEHTALRMPQNLAVFRISVFVYDHSESVRAAHIIRPIVDGCACPNLHRIVFHAVLVDSFNLRDYHTVAQKLISDHAPSLKSLNIHIKQVLFNPITAVLLGDHSVFEDRDSKIGSLQLRQFRLTIDRYFDKWLPLLTQSKNEMRSLELNVRGASWRSLEPVISVCIDTLEELSVLNISSIDGTRVSGLDMGILRQCKNLRSLNLSHQERTVAIFPNISRTGYLPRSLETVTISRFIVKYHQVLFFLIQLPNLKNLTLNYWNESQDALRATLAVLPFLFKFHITSVTNLELTDTNRLMSNARKDAIRLDNFLGRATGMFKKEVTENDTTFRIVCDRCDTSGIVVDGLSSVILEKKASF